MEAKKVEHKDGSSRASLDVLHHIAIEVRDLDATVDWYLAKFTCELTYRDDTWAMLRFQNCELAFVQPAQHPPHLAIVREDAESFGELVTHRDGTRSRYMQDPSGNTVEVCAPEFLVMPSLGSADGPESTKPAREPS